jgi:hypothetical protein
MGVFQQDLDRIRNAGKLGEARFFWRSQAKYFAAAGAGGKLSGRVRPQMHMSVVVQL